MTNVIQFPKERSKRILLRLTAPKKSVGQTLASVSVLSYNARQTNPAKDCRTLTERIANDFNPFTVNRKVRK